MVYGFGKGWVGEDDRTCARVVEDTIPALKDAVVPIVERKGFARVDWSRLVWIFGERVCDALVGHTRADGAAACGYGRLIWAKRKEVRLAVASSQDKGPHGHWG